MTLELNNNDHSKKGNMTDTKLFPILFENESSLDEKTTLFIDQRNTLFEFVHEEIIPKMFLLGWRLMTPQEYSQFVYKDLYDLRSLEDLEEESKRNKRTWGYFPEISPEILVFTEDPEIYLGFNVGVNIDSYDLEKATVFLNLSMNFGYSHMEEVYVRDSIYEEAELLTELVQEWVVKILPKVSKERNKPNNKDKSIYSIWKVGRSVPDENKPAVPSNPNNAWYNNPNNEDDEQSIS